MKNKKKLIILMVQIIAIIFFIMSYKNYTDTVLKPIKVYTWAREMGEGTQIKETDIVVGKASSTDYNANMILASDAKAIIGSYTTTRVFPNTYAYYNQVGDETVKQSDFENLDLTNARVISLPVSMSSDAGCMVQQGDKIDLMFTANGSAKILSGHQAVNSETGSEGVSVSESSTSFTYSKIFMNEVVVYRTLTGDGFKTSYRSDRWSGEGPDVTDIGEGVSADSGSISILLLIVTPEQAEEIKTRQQKGSITVVKRFEESETHDSLGYVMGNYGKVFAGNGNAETGSLQIISTVQDTDENSPNGSGAQQAMTGGNVIADGDFVGTDESTENTQSQGQDMQGYIGAVSVE